MSIFEKFSVLKGVPSEILSRLDRNFNRVPQTYDIIQTSVDYTLKVTDTITSIQVDATSGDTLVYLPDQPVGKRRYTMTKTDSSANFAVFDGNGSLINGAAQQAIGTQYDSITVEPTGTGWIIVACVP